MVSAAQSSPPHADAGRPAAGGGIVPWVMLAIATLGFGVNFWAWALLSPLAPRLQEDLGLSSFQVSLLVAVPVIVGAVGRIPVGAMTDRFGGRLMFPAVTVVTILPVLFIGLLGHGSFAALLVGGFFLGIGGTIFAVGVPVVNAWFPPARRGLAIGIYGVGMGGTAVSALTTVQLVDARDMAAPFLLVAVVLAAYAVLSFLFLRDAPERVVPTQPLAQRLGDTMKLAVTWQMSALYAVAFGGYVAFSVYLPAYLKSGYDLTQQDAAAKMAGFVLLAVAMRPVGGALSDRFGPVPVINGVMAVVALGAALQASTPPLNPLGTIAFLSMAAALGAGSGAVFALVALLAPANKVGTVTGVVGAAGGLGGFVPPLLMGALYGWFGNYATGMSLLAAVAAAALLFNHTSVRRAVASR